MKSIIDCIYWRLKNTIKSEKQHPRVGRYFKTGQEGINWKLEFKTNQFHSDMWAKIQIIVIRGFELELLLLKARGVN